VDNLAKKDQIVDNSAISVDNLLITLWITHFPNPEKMGSVVAENGLCCGASKFFIEKEKIF